MRDNLTGLLINGLSPLDHHHHPHSVVPSSSASGGDALVATMASVLTTAIPALLSSDTANRSVTPWESLPGNYTVCPSTEMPWSNVVFMVLYSVVAVVGLLGNTLVIYVVLRFSNMQTVTNMYILNLAIADECFLVGIPFIIATMSLGRWPFGTFICKAYMVSTSITQFTSSLFLLVMSTDRYIAICHHVSSPKYRTPFVSRVVSAVAWTTSALIMLPIMMYATTIEVQPDTFTCHILWPEDGHTGAVSFILYSFTLGFALPLCFIMTFYCLVIRKLRELSKKTNKSHNKRRSHRKVTKLVLTVITVYVLCWLPYWTSQMALIANPEACNTRLSITIFLFVGVLGYSNSAINPVLYAYLSDNFKKSFLKACVCAGTREVNAQLKVENSVLPRKARNGKRLNSDFGTTTAVSSSTAATAATKHRKFLAETTLGTTSTSLTKTSSSLVPSSLLPSPSTTLPGSINHNLTNHQPQKRNGDKLQDHFGDSWTGKVDAEKNETDDEEAEEEEEEGLPEEDNDEGLRGMVDKSLIKI